MKGKEMTTETAQEILNRIRSKSTYKKRVFTKPLTVMNEEYGRLICPCCKDEESNLHHSRVEVFNRKEDASTGNHTIVDGASTTVNNDISDNPSPRREGISIVFWCEQCCEESILDIIQHKGMSYMRWFDGKAFGK